MRMIATEGAEQTHVVLRWERVTDASAVERGLRLNIEQSEAPPHRPATTLTCCTRCCAQNWDRMVKCCFMSVPSTRSMDIRRMRVASDLVSPATKLRDGRLRRVKAAEMWWFSMGDPACTWGGREGKDGDHRSWPQESNSWIAE